MRKYWYYRYFGECPVCGKDKSYRKRVLGKKPKDPKKTFEYIPDWITYDRCDNRA